MTNASTQDQISPPRRAHRGRVVVISTFVAVAALATATLALRPAGAAESSEFVQATDNARSMQRTRAAIPQGMYRALIVSPAPLAPDAGPNSSPFILRMRDANGTVEDFAFHVQPGETLTMPFSTGLTLATDALLVGPPNVPFAAWGQTDNGLIRAEDVSRDPLGDRAARDRERDFESFLRERGRARVR
ncbi:MAG: hypothetical protein KF768_09610 [Phycisphaeraceae bacterium]|nr:hypothetical protein [Phycisphaeraceae bacterium]